MFSGRGPKTNRPRGLFVGCQATIGVGDGPIIVFVRETLTLSQRPATDRRYPDAMPFSSDDLRAIDRAKEIEVETSAGPDADVHRTIIWVVVDGDDVFVRSWRGVTARWFREALANPDIAINIDGRRIPARAVPARDPGSISRTSAGLLQKYDGDTATPSMVRDEILDTTLRLDPAATA